MKAAVFERFGEPAEVLEIRETDMPEPKAGEVRVRMLASPINPSDLLTVRGHYPRLPRLPATIGFEGCGVVDKIGAGWFKYLRGLSPGKRVSVLNARGGNWAEYVVVPVEHVVPAGNLTDSEAATFFVNPATAWVMVREVLNVPRDAWLLQTAAGSALGKMIQRLADREGIRVLNVVRRRAQAQEMKQAGLVAVATEESDFEQQVRELIKEDGVRYAVDAVGGDTATAVAKLLGRGGRLLLCGLLSGQPMTVDPRTLMTVGASIEGFWLAIWVQQQGKLKMLQLFNRLHRLIKEGVLATETEEFPLADIKTAVQKSEEVGRTTKVLLRIST